jgi:hypothetical protein
MSDARLRSIRARHPHFVILRYRIAPLASSTTAEFGQKFSTSRSPITRGVFEQFSRIRSGWLHREPNARNTESAAAAASPIWTAVNLQDERDEPD